MNTFNVCIYIFYFSPNRQTISCFYVVNETQTVAFSANPRTYEPAAEIGTGQLMVQMRLAQGMVEFYYILFMDTKHCKCPGLLSLTGLFSCRSILRALLPSRGLSSGEISAAASVF